MYYCMLSQPGHEWWHSHKPDVSNHQHLLANTCWRVGAPRTTPTWPMAYGSGEATARGDGRANQIQPSPITRYYLTVSLTCWCALQQPMHCNLCTAARTQASTHWVVLLPIQEVCRSSQHLFMSTCMRYLTACPAPKRLITARKLQIHVQFMLKTLQYYNFVPSVTSKF